MKALVLRTVCNDMISCNNFRWPESGYVEAPDWDPKPVCGRGLHGLLWGCGRGGYLDWNGQEFVGLVVEVEEGECVDLCGKVKFPKGNVVFCGNIQDAANYIYERHPGPVCGIRLVGGNGFNVIGGDRCILIGGHRSTLMGGGWATLIGGDCSTLIGGYNSNLIGGIDSILIGGDCSTLTSGGHSALIGGEFSTLTVGHFSTLRGGVGSSLSVKHFDYENNRQKIKIAHVGEDGIEPNVPYKLNEYGEFEKIKI